MEAKGMSECSNGGNIIIFQEINGNHACWCATDDCPSLQRNSIEGGYSIYQFDCERSDDSRYGSDDMNSGSDDGQYGSGDMNSGSDDMNSGSDDMNSGSDDMNSRSDDMNRGSDASRSSMGSRN